MEGGGEERSRPIAKRRDGVCRRVSSVPRGAPVPPPARRGSAVPAPLAAPRGRRAPALAARSGLGAEHSRLPRISLPAASRRRLARSRLCGRAGQRGSRSLPSRRLAALHPREGSGVVRGGPFPPTRQPPPRSFPEPLCNAVPCRPTRGERRPPPEQPLCPGGGGVGGHSTPRQTGSEKPRRPRWEGGRDWPGVPSGEEGEGSRGRRAESEVQAWGSWTRARGEAGNPRPGGHSPFPAQRGQGSTFRRCPRLPPEHGPGWGCGTPGGGTGESRPPQVPTGPRPGLPALLHRHHHLPTTPGQRSPGPVSCRSPPAPVAPPPPHPSAGLAAGRGDKGDCERDGRRAGRRRLSAALLLLAARAAASFFGRSLCSRLPRTPARAERGHRE